MLILSQCTPYPLTATIFSTDLYQDPRFSKIFNYEPDVVNAIMNGSKEPAKTHSKQTSCDETSNRSKQSANKDKLSSTVHMLTHEHATDETENLLAQCSGLAQVTSSRYVSHLYSHV